MELVTAYSFVGSRAAYRLPLGALADEGGGRRCLVAEGNEELRRHLRALEDQRAPELLCSPGSSPGQGSSLATSSQGLFLLPVPRPPSE